VRISPARPGLFHPWACNQVGRNSELAGGHAPGEEEERELHDLGSNIWDVKMPTLPAVLHSIKRAPGNGENIDRFRVTFRFLSDRGRDYLYDDATGAILPWSELREAVLRLYMEGNLARNAPELAEEYGEAKVANAIRFVKHWVDRHRAFFRNVTPTEPPPDGAQCLEIVRLNCVQLVLVVTENCNMRCRYCAYSGNYEHVRQHSAKSMAPETARRAVDWFAELIEPQRRRNPLKKYGLSFYGGEPLTNMPAVRAALDHAADKHPCLFQPNLTTNGLLLTAETAEYLAKHDTRVAVSLDGPQAEHDRERVDMHGEGTHGRIMRNLVQVCNAVPSFVPNGGFITVYSYKSDLAGISRFFGATDERMPRVIFAQPVFRKGTHYWDHATEVEMQRYRDRMQERREHYKRAMVEGENVNSFDHILMGGGIAQVALRKRVNDRGLAFLPYSGACMPGHKIAVQTDGQLDLCEKVNFTYPLGTLETGLDGERIRQLILMYQESVLKGCSMCNVTRLCGLCYAHTLENGRIGKPGEMCHQVQNGCKQNLRDFVSIKESNPNANFAWETDTALLEKRFLMFR